MNLFPLALVLADIGDVIGSVVGILFLVVWIIGQLTGAKKQPKLPAAQRPAPRQPPPQGAPQAGQPAAPPAAAGADPLRDQVEEFLRRAGRVQKPNQAQPAQGQRPQAKRPPAAARDKIELLVPDERSERKPKRLSEPFRSMKKPAPPARPSSAAAKERSVAQRTARPEHESVAEHVQEHVDASMRAIAQHSSQLGQSVIRADEQFDDELHSKFDHELGSLSQRHDKRMSEQEAAPEPKTPAQQIAAMLTNPEGVRQAIVLNEILRRPADRWE